MLHDSAARAQEKAVTKINVSAFELLERMLSL
jgi:hypothetical protein